MRNAFAKEITELARKDERVVLLSGDIGNKLFDEFKETAPDRFYNCGIAEANMIGLAAGLAMSGLRPIAYTITPFITYRCFEQIRLDVCYHNVPVIIVGVGAGLSYASLGATHHSCEDIAVLRSLPNMTVVCPADAKETRACLREALAASGPVYMRIGKKGEPVMHAAEPAHALTSAHVMKPGKDLCIVSTGTILPVALEAGELLKQRNVAAEVVSLPTVKPLNEKFMQEIFGRFDLVVSVEEHSLIGGLGASMAEWRNDNNAAGKLLRIGTPDEFFHEAGEQEHAREVWGLTAGQIVEKIEAARAVSSKRHAL